MLIDYQNVNIYQDEHLKPCMQNLISMMAKQKKQKS